MKQYLKLLMFREGWQVLGKRGANLWLLSIVLVATFSSIAFSEGSMIYLRDKMENPFTNWVSVTSDDAEKFKMFRDSLEIKENKLRFGYTNVREGQLKDLQIQGINEHQYYLTGRFSECMGTPVMKAVLSDENVINGARLDSLADNSFGVVITLDVAKRLGYSETHLPTYVNCMSYSPGADSLGVKLIGNPPEFALIPLPVLGVVHRLPDNVEVMGSNFLHNQISFNDDTHPFNMSEHEEYQHQLHYFLSENVTDSTFLEYILSIIPDTLKERTQIFQDMENLYPMQSWKRGQMVTVELSKFTLPRELFQKVTAKIEKKFSKDDVQRVYIFDTRESEKNKLKSIDYISVDFTTLDSIRAFERFAKDKFDIQIEMSQVASKENFNAVTVMAAILSAAMVIFSLVCIIMFLVNMLQSYFQKVRKNIGTFKAFGMKTSELIWVYVIILIFIVSAAVVIAFVVTWAIQELLPVVGIERDGFNYLSLWNNTTYIATSVIFISTVVTVCVVMIRMLSHTPGDLIYDRDM